MNIYDLLAQLDEVKAKLDGLERTGQCEVTGMSPRCAFQYGMLRGAISDTYAALGRVQTALGALAVAQVLKLTDAESGRRSEILIGLSPEEIEERRHCIGASDANIILGGDEGKIIDLWKFKTGQADAEDLSDVLAVQMGVWTEAFNIRWYEKQTGCRVTHRQTKVPHPTLPWLVSSLDGRTVLADGRPAVIDAKHVNAFTDMDACAAKYLPQMTVQMTCTEVECAVVSAFFGSMKWEHRVLELDPFYQARVIGALRKFWGHCQDKTPPCNMPTIDGPALPTVMMRTVDLSMNNSWCAWENEYLSYEEAADRHEAAQKELKGLIESDVREVTGKFIVARRDKRGAIRFSKKKGKK